MKRKLDRDRLKIIYERNRERGMIIEAIKRRGAATISEIAEITGLEKERVLTHIIALQQLGRLEITGEREYEFIYSLSR